MRLSVLPTSYNERQAYVSTSSNTGTQLLTLNVCKHTHEPFLMPMLLSPLIIDLIAVRAWEKFSFLVGSKASMYNYVRYKPIHVEGKFELARNHRLIYVMARFIPKNPCKQVGAGHIDMAIWLIVHRRHRARSSM